MDVCFYPLVISWWQDPGPNYRLRLTHFRFPFSWDKSPITQLHVSEHRASMIFCPCVILVFFHWLWTVFFLRLNLLLLNCIVGTQALVELCNATKSSLRKATVQSLNSCWNELVNTKYTWSTMIGLVPHCCLTFTFTFRPLIRRFYPKPLTTVSTHHVVRSS